MVENGLRNQRIAVWDGPGMLLIWAVALLAFARSVPPPAPTDSAQQIAAIFLRRSDFHTYRHNLDMCRSRLTRSVFVVISLQLSRIEGGLCS
jgi:hypothetical protein